MPASRPLDVRFWSKVDKAGPVPTGHPEYEGLGPCWCYNRGKGPLLALPLSHTIAPGEKKKVLAYRYSWEIHNGEIPAGLIVRHRCDNGSGTGINCVNPAHLVIGTQKQNVEDRYRRRIVPDHVVTSAMAEALIELRDAYNVPVDLLARAVGSADVVRILQTARVGVAPAERRRPVNLTPEEIDRAAALVTGGASVRAASIAIGRSLNAVAPALGARGVVQSRTLLTAEELATVRAILAEGRSVGAAAHTIGRSWNRVRKALHDAGLDAEIPAEPVRDQRISDEKREANRKAALASRWRKFRERKASGG